MRNYTHRPGPGPGEITFKQWLSDEAERMGSTPTAIRRKVARGVYWRVVNVRRVNKRVIYVIQK